MKESIYARLRRIDINQFTWKEITPILIGLTLFTVRFGAYSYGIGDHGIHIPLIKSYMDPSLYPGDPLIEQKSLAFSFLWIIVAKIAQFVNLELIFFFIYFISLFSIYFMIFRLTELIFESKASGLVSVLLFTFPKRLLGGVDTFDLILKERLVALPLLLLSIFLFLENRYILALFIAGISFNIHALSSGLVFGMFGYYFLINIRAIDKKLVLTSFGSYVLAALPTLLWIFSSLSWAVVPNPEWIQIMKIRLLHEAFPSDWNWKIWTIYLIFPTLFFFIALRYIRYKPKAEIHKKIITFCFAILIACILGTVFTVPVKIPIIIKLHLFRTSRFFTIFSVIYTGDYLRTILQLKIKTSIIQKFASVLVIFVLFNIPYDIRFYRLLLLPAWLLYIFDNRSKFSKYLNALLFARKSVFRGMMILVIFSLLFHVYKYAYWTHQYLNGEIGLQWAWRFEGIEYQRDTWIDIQIWAKTNTPKDSIFIVPPYEGGFRVYSERSILGCWKDGTLSNYNETFAVIWWERMQDLGYSEDNGDEYNRAIYESLNFQWLAKKYNASYIVTEQPGIHINFTRVYENVHYVVFLLAVL